VDETVYLLEMTTRGELVAARGGPRNIQLSEVAAAEAELARSTYERIGAPLRWSGRMGWTAGEWHDELTKSDVRAWVAVVNQEIAGLVELEAAPSGDVGIVIFGLVPEFIGRGLGGALLSIVTDLAWRLSTAGGVRTRRVWIETSSRDHPAALPNYEARGFRVYRTERRRSAP
jgi:GNAT superfamily N-acetyltransferase